MINNVEIVKHQPIGSSKEQIIAEFDNLAAWEKTEVLDELCRRMRRNVKSLSEFSNRELKTELRDRGEY